MFLASLGKEVSGSDLDFIFEGRRRRDILIHFLGELSDSEVQEYGSEKDEFFPPIFPHARPVAGSIEFIRELEKSGLCIAVATSASRQRARWTLGQLTVWQMTITGANANRGYRIPSLYPGVTWQQ